jgi:hypothetical protein
MLLDFLSMTRLSEKLSEAKLKLRAWSALYIATSSIGENYMIWAIVIHVSFWSIQSYSAQEYLEVNQEIRSPELHLQTLLTTTSAIDPSATSR